MRQIDQLWKYQQQDMAVARFEAEMRKDPMRQKLLRLRNVVSDQQTIVQGMEKDAAASLARLEEIEQAQQNAMTRLEKGQTRIDEDGYESAQQAHQAAGDIQRLVERLTAMRAELEKMSRASRQMVQRLKEVRQKAVQARDEYQQLKAKYDAVLANQTAKLEELKKARDEAAVGLSEQSLQQYNKVRGQCMPPMAKLAGNQCLGCNMSLPSAALQAINSEQFVECENCGRILYVPEE